MKTIDMSEFQTGGGALSVKTLVRNGFLKNTFYNY